MAASPDPHTHGRHNDGTTAGFRDAGSVDPKAQDYIEGIAPETRPLFDRVHGLILGEFPDVEVGLAYGMPTYRCGDRRLYMGAWKHGVSLYGWPDDGALSILGRHPELSSGRGTLKITHAVAEDISDGELVELFRTALGEGS